MFEVQQITIWKVDYHEEKNFFDFNVIVIFDDGGVLRKPSLKVLIEQLLGFIR